MKEENKIEFYLYFCFRVVLFDDDCYLLNFLENYEYKNIEIGALSYNRIRVKIHDKGHPIISASF